MKSGLALVLVGAFLAQTRGATAEEGTDVLPGTKVRLSAGRVVEIPGVVRIDGMNASASGRVVLNNTEMIAVQVPGQEAPVALLRPGVRLPARLTAIDDDAITISLEGQPYSFRVPRFELTQLEMSKEGKPAGLRILRGAGIGLAVGALGGAFLGLMSGDDDRRNFFSVTAEEN